MKFIRVICGGEQVVNPLYQAIEIIGPVMMSIVALLGIIWGIILGTRYAKAGKSEEKAAVHSVHASAVQTWQRGHGALHQHRCPD